MFAKASSSSKIILVTGATDGIGRETALELGRRGAHVLVHGRSEKKVKDVVAEVKKAGAPGGEAFVADLAKLKDVRALAEEVTRRTKRLDVLINNAGVMQNERTVTEDGFETTFQVNHLSHFLLTNLLLPLLKASAPSRIVNVSSMVHSSGEIDFDDLQMERGYSSYGAYASSKLANVLFTLELAERLEGTGVTVNALHPGVINTKLLRGGFGAMGGGSVKRGAETSVYCALDPSLEKVSGRYFSDSRESHMAPRARDERLRKQLWDVSAKLVGL